MCFMKGSRPCRQESGLSVQSSMFNVQRLEKRGPEADIGSRTSEVWKAEEEKKIISRPLRSTNTDDKDRQKPFFSGRLWPEKRMSWPAARKS